MTKSETLELNKIDIINAYKNGSSSRDIGKQFNCNSGLVYMKLKEWEVDIKQSKKYSNSAKERMYPLIKYMSKELNYGIQKISNILQCSQNFVSRTFKKLNIDYFHRVVKSYFLNHEEVKTLYESGLSTTKIAKKLKCNQVTILDILKKLNVETRPINKYEFKRDILDNGINTPELAWLWGLWLTDGNVRKNRVRIGMCDKDIIDKLKIIFQYTGHIYTKYRVGRKHIHELNINNTELAEKFINLGCIPNKTHYITYPEHIDFHLLPHFFRGILEGDGSITKKNVSITGNLPLLLGIKNKLIKYTILKEEDFHFYTRHPERKNNIRTMMFTKKSTSKVFLDYLYGNSKPEIRMDRKYELYLKYYNVSQSASETG